VDIRIGPQERLDIVGKLNEARLKQQGEDEVVQVQQQRVNRLQKATVGEALSRRELDDALVALAEARIQAATAKSAVELWQRAVDAIERGGDRNDGVWTESLTVPIAGEVTELAGRPGMALEAGGLVARVVDFSRPLVRVDLPPETLVAGPPAQVDLSVAAVTPTSLGAVTSPSAGPAPVVAGLVGAAPQVDAASQMSGYWYEVRIAPAVAPRGEAQPPLHSSTVEPLIGVRRPPSDGTGPGWRPGLFVKAALRAAGRQQEVIAVPAEGVLYHQGRALVYVRVTPGKFERREVRLLAVEGDRALLAGGVREGERVVARNAQVLLSEEFRGDADND
jgi:hypothetical protein